MEVLNSNLNIPISKKSEEDSFFSDLDFPNYQSNTEATELNTISNNSNQKYDNIKSNNNLPNEKPDTTVTKDVISKSVQITPKPLIKSFMKKELISTNHRLLNGKRRRKTSNESSQTKIHCRRAERSISESIKNCFTSPLVQSSDGFNHINSCSDNSNDSVIDTAINNQLVNESSPKKNCLQERSAHHSKTPVCTKIGQSALDLKEQVNNAEYELKECNKEREFLMEYRLKIRECLSKTLIEKFQMEREAIKERIHNNKFQLGQFINIRQGVHYEQKWTGGLKFEDLEKRKKLIEEQRDENEKRKKALNKSKPGNDKGKQSKSKLLLELDPTEFFIQAEINDINRLNINKEEKDLQTEFESLSRERNSHIREIRRIEHEEASRFHHFPTLNDRYLILSLLGKGGFSEVHKGFDFEQLRFVACKIHELNPSWSHEKKDSYIKHALREISIHKQLDHQRIVRVHDVFNIDNDAFCTVLEYCEGNDLDFHLKQNKFIPERDAKSLICQVVSALKYLNDRKNPIIHYDLKPGNILLCNNGEIKITDFGLSKIFPDDHHNPDGMELTSQGAGTYWYLPPECFVTENGPPTISNKVDVWSVGVIFYQCLYGIKPFGNNMTQTDILQNNTILQAKHIEFLPNPRVSEATKDFIRRCCTYSKELRPDVFQIHNDDYFKPKPKLNNKTLT